MRLISILLATLSVGAAVACDRTSAEAPAANGASAPVSAGDIGLGTRPAWREVTIPAGTTLTVVLDTTIGSDISRVEQPVEAHVSRTVTVRGEDALPEGTRVSGVITDATESAKVEGRAHVAVRFNSLSTPDSKERYPIETASYGRTAEGTKGKDALEIGGGAAGGAIIGALFGGKKGALIGTAVGGGAGTAVVLSTKGKEIHVRSGTRLSLRLTAPVTIRVRG